ncbi:MAG TPA: DUF1932 domain-containing protein, partial [Acidimicrobiales bacterium]
MATIPQTTADQPLRTAGVLHPGSMGVTVGAALRHGGTPVLWASSGRGPATRDRAAEAGLRDVTTLDALCSSSDVVLSVCPPDAALDLARGVAATGFSGVFVDANAVSPRTALEIGAIVTDGGAEFVDGGIIGEPAHRPGTTRLYLAGAAASSVAALFHGAALEARVLDQPPGAASALKVAYAAYTKGTAALLLTVQAFAKGAGIDEALRSEWALSQPELLARADGVGSAAAPKAWRWVGEMHEIAAACADAGLPDGFHEASAEVFRRLSGFKDTERAGVEEVLDQ